MTDPTTREMRIHDPLTGKTYPVICGGSDEQPAAQGETSQQPAETAAPAAPAEPPRNTRGQFVTVSDPEPPATERPAVQQAFDMDAFANAVGQVVEQRLTPLQQRLEEQAQQIETFQSRFQQEQQGLEGDAPAPMGQQPTEQQNFIAPAGENGPDFQSEIEELRRKYAEIEADRERERALRERETELRELSDYRQARLQEEQSHIAPQIMDFVSGSSREEIDAAIERAKNATQGIFDEVSQAQANQSVARRTASPTGAPSVDTTAEGGTRQLSAQDIRDMPLSDFAKYRPQLLGQAATRQGGQGRGMFG